MLLAGINSDHRSLQHFKALLASIPHQRLYLNTPVRAPAESWVKPCSAEVMERAASTLGGQSIAALVSNGFHSEIEDHYEAVISIIKRHPMTAGEIRQFLASRRCAESEQVILRLQQAEVVAVTNYRGIPMYRLR